MPGTVAHVVGARPNFMKAAPVIRALERAGVAQAIIHSGQHYDAAMSDVFFRDLGLPVPDRNLGVGSGGRGEPGRRPAARGRRAGFAARTV